VKGVFITFEGCESCGKSTQSKLLCDYLRVQGYDVVFLREPGGTVVSEKIRRILLDPLNKGMCDEAELLLYMASRAQTVQEVIRPAVKAGKIVLCDRFLDSSLVYQGYGLGMDIGFIRELGSFTTGGIEPDLTLLLDVPLKRALDGIKHAKDRIEQRAFAYHKRVKKGYMSLAEKEPRRIKIVTLEDDKMRTQDKIRALALPLVRPCARK
jgi:dTMP kinase